MTCDLESAPTAASVFLSSLDSGSSGSESAADGRDNLQLHERRMNLLDEIEADLSVTDSLVSRLSSDDEQMATSSHGKFLWKQ